jgi:hypothetical protein
MSSISHESFSFLPIFSLHSKAILTMTLNRVPRGKHRRNKLAHARSWICDAMQLRCSLSLPAPAKTRQRPSWKVKTTRYLRVQQTSNVWSRVNWYNLNWRPHTTLIWCRVCKHSFRQHRRHLWTVKKYCKDISCSGTNFSASSGSPNPIYENKLNLTTDRLHRSHQSFPFGKIFGCTSKPRRQRRWMKHWEGKKCKGWYGSMFRCLHLLKLQTHSLQMFLELRKPIYPELMSARHANRASCW